MRVAVIGAGPSGLVTLKYLLEAQKTLSLYEPIEARCFESEADIGGTFLARAYEDAQLVSSKQLTAFSDFRARDEDGDFLDVKRYTKYLRDYCTHFNLWPHIHLRTSVKSVRRCKGSGHVVVFEERDSTGLAQWKCDAVAVCSGLHLTPNVPRIPGLDKVPMVIHSSEFKERKQFGVDKTVLIIGSGETGADVAYLAVTSPTRRVVMSHRDGFHFAPQRNLNPTILPILGRKPSKELTIPVDHGRASLFDTAYIHPILRKHDALFWNLYDFYVKYATWATTGSTAGIDQWIGEISPERHHVSKIFFNKAGGKVNPYLSAPYRPKKPSAINKIRSCLIQAPVPNNGGRVVDLAPLPEYIDENGVIHFCNNNRPEYQTMKEAKIKPDIAVLCTGYKQNFPFFSAASRPEAAAAATAEVREGRRKDDDDDDTVNRPYPTSHTSADVRQIWAHSDPTIGFIGFVRPSLGAIPPLSEMQAQLWILRIAAPQRIPRPLAPADEHHYRLRQSPTARIQYGVDHDSYVYQLALDMDAALGFMEAVRRGWRRRDWGWRFPVVWALTGNLNAKFRVRGPWRWEGAEEVMMGEMWASVKRRRLFFDHFLLSILPMSIFGPLSLVCWLYATLVGAVFGEWDTAPVNGKASYA